MKEHIDLLENFAVVKAPIPFGKHVRQIGEDLKSDEIILPAGSEIRSADMAAIMMAGVNRLKVLPRPRVAVVPTGSEIVDSGAPLPPGSIRDVNSYMLAALLRGWGADVRRHAVVPDDVDQIRATLRDMVAVSDMVVINAGTSKGSEDFTAGVLNEIGSVCCHGLAIRPGRPLILAVVEGKPVIGLPGYPVSCMLTAELFVREFIYEFQGKKIPERQKVKAILGENIKSVAGVEEFIRVKLTGKGDLFVASPLPRGASLISTLTRAQGFISVPPDHIDLLRGDEVTVELF